MKTKLAFVRLVPALMLLWMVSGFPHASAFAQGNLTPPGAPAPTMKSLDQIESRTAISSAPFTITQPGSYYLSSNITVSAGDALTINANNVTLDLNGFTIFSTAPSAVGTAILCNSRTNISIFNGNISGGVTNSDGVFSGSGFSSGIFGANGSANMRVTRVSVSGCLNSGIFIDDDGSVAQFCTAASCGFAGIRAAVVSDCAAMNCGNYGIYSDVASNCRGTCFEAGTGVYAYSAAYNCSGWNYGSAPGYGVYSSYLATGCFGYSQGGTGLRAYIANSCYGSFVTATYKYNMP
jgi:hypothetical protein